MLVYWRVVEFGEELTPHILEKLHVFIALEFFFSWPGTLMGDEKACGGGAVAGCDETLKFIQVAN